jgi:hypothetical protein
MTRARDKLIMTYASRYLENTLKDYALRYDMSGDVLMASDVSSMGEWVIQTAMDRVEAGELFALEREGEFLCVGALFCEDVRWPEPAKARYLHHFAAKVGEKGAGSLFLQEAEKFAGAEGMEYMRLDSAVGNERLAHYYESRGYVSCGHCRDGLYQGILRQKKL